MLAELFRNIVGNLRIENKILKFVVVVIGLCELWNSHKIDLAMKYQRTILVPSNLDRRVVITGDRASEDYVRGWARTITNLAFNYTPASARGQYGELLGYFASDAFPAAKAAFFSLADTIERTRLCSQFVITHPVDVDNDKGVMTVTGAQRQWVENNFVDSAEKVYVINYKILDGRFFVTAINEKAQGRGVTPKGGEKTAPANGGK